MMTLREAAIGIATETINMNTALAALPERDAYRFVVVKRAQRNIAAFAIAVGCADFNEFKRELAAEVIANGFEAAATIDADGLCAVADWHKHGTSKLVTDDVR